MVERAVAHGPGRRDELGDQAGEGQGHVRLAGGVQDDAHVLVVQVDPETRAELPGDHRLALEVEDAVGGQPAGQHVEPGLGVHAGGLQQHDGLADQPEDARHDKLVGGLDHLPGAVTADVHDGAPEDLEERPGGGEVGLVAAHHDRQGGLFGADLTAGDGRVQHPYGMLGGRASHRERGFRADRAHVDQQRAGPGGGQDPAVAEDDLLDLRVVGQHRDHHLGRAHRLRDRSGRDEPGRGQQVDRRPVHVEPGDPMPGGDQVARHRRPHDPQADEPDRGHERSPAVVRRFSNGSQRRLSTVSTDGRYSRPTKPR